MRAGCLPRASARSSNVAAADVQRGGILTGGVRWLGERFAADLALVVPTDGGTTVAFPLVNVVYTFSRGREHR